MPLSGKKSPYRAVRISRANSVFSPVEIARAHLAQLKPVLNAFQIAETEGAMAAAQASEARWRNGTTRGKHDGAPATIMDNVDLAGLPTRSGSTTTPNATSDAPVAACTKPAPQPPSSPAVRSPALCKTPPPLRLS